MTSIQWASDIHLDTCNEIQFQEFLESINPSLDMLITGDISKSTRIESDLERIARQLNGRKLYFVMGNHDYYGNTINLVRYRLRSFLKDHENIVYLPDNDDMKDPIYVGGKWQLIGVDGWADGRSGNFESSPAMLRDYTAINDFVGKDDSQRKHLLHVLGQEEAFYLDKKLEGIESSHILIATHVPPYEEAHLFGGVQSSAAYLPHFVCKSTGEVITRFADENPDKTIHVVCGHTHHACNIRVGSVGITVAHAEYTKPSIGNIATSLQ